ncbi:beta strand repeat-containing protein [Aerosakkonemataceae cyanobacterium BLCC-F50]|uniref:Beta strand repeat-containing protein n=1 Tax=Floridaenema flaviceps BLCC-F50 TaxID=3153642 RepID=A0ABV4XX73_9CYAN
MAFIPLTGFGNPFSPIDVGNDSAPILIDFDKDGDLDAIVTERQSGNISYYYNGGDATLPIYVQVTGTNNPFNGITLQYGSTPAIYQIGDGSYRLFTLYTLDPRVDFPSTPTMIDLDKDGDLDIVFGDNTGGVHYVKNFATSGNGEIIAIEQTGSDNPFNTINVGSNSAPIFGDLDKDGDFDLVLGAGDGTLKYYKNIGSATNPVYSEQTGSNNPFLGIDVGNNSFPTLGDLNGDGNVDLVVGAADGTLKYYFNNLGNDVINGSSDNDTLDGGIGDDLIAGRQGNDLIIGGIGFDQAYYYGGYTEYRVSFLNNGDVQVVDRTISYGNEGTDTLSGIEEILFGDGGIYRVVTGGAGNDVLSANPSYVTLLFGGAGNDNITGGPGADTLAGAAGDDTLNGVAANDSINGGDGFDYAVYQGLFNQYTVSFLNNGDVQIVGNEGTDTLTQIEQINFANGGAYRVVTGGAGNDVLTTNYIYSLMYGGAGNDNITGGSGNDTLNGAADNDTLNGAAGNDSIQGGAGNDLIIGGADFDTAAYLGAFTEYGVSFLNNGDVQIVDQNLSNGNEGTDTLSGIEQINFANGGTYRVVTGGAGNDVLTANPSYVALMFGGAGNDNIAGASGADTLAGAAGNDTLNGSTGNDSINGGDGFDHVVYERLFDQYTVSFLNNGDVQIFGYEGLDTLNQIEQINFGNGGVYRVVTGGAGNDVLTTNSFFSLMYGGAGNDNITGGSGNDTLNGAADNDTLNGAGNNDSIQGGAGNDLIQGGADFDTAAYLGAFTEYGVSFLNNGDVQIVDQNLSNGNEGTDTLSGIEQINFIGNGGIYRVYTGGAGNDILTANPSYVALMFGGAGNDNITGASGADTLAGGAGNDTLRGGTGADRFMFNAPTDAIDLIADFKRSEGDKVLIKGSGFGVTSTSAFSFNFNTKALLFNGQQIATIAVANSTDFSVASDLAIF